jgi:hypothetical protein
MSLSKSKCCYSNNCLQFLKCAVPLTSSKIIRPKASLFWRQKMLMKLTPEENQGRESLDVELLRQVGEGRGVHLGQDKAFVLQFSGSLLVFCQK